MPGRVALGRFDLDNVSTEVAEDATHIGTEWRSNIQDTYTFQSPGGFLMIGSYHVHSIIGQNDVYASGSRASFSYAAPPWSPKEIIPESIGARKEPTALPYAVHHLGTGTFDLGGFEQCCQKMNLKLLTPDVGCAVIPRC
jgi:hypothetical protein